MSIVPCGYTAYGWECAPPVPLLMNPAKSVQLTEDPDDGMPMLVFQSGMRIRVNPAGSTAAAALWWQELGMAGLRAGLRYQELLHTGAGPEPAASAVKPGKTRRQTASRT